MSGGKGGSTTTSVQVPEYIEKAAQRNLNKAEAISQIGYVPYYGPDVAAFSPMQNAAFQNTGNLAGAFGMATPTGQNVYGSMGAPTDFGNGVTGYSSQPIYQQAVDTLRAERPGQYNAMTQMFVDPYSGSTSNYMLPQIDYTNIATAAEVARNESAADRANQLAIAQAQANANPQSMSYYNYNNQDFSTSSPATTYITNPAEGITNTDTAGPATGLKNDIQEQLIGNTVGLIDPTYKVGEINNPIQTPTVGEMVAATPNNMNYNPSTGSYQATGNTAPTSSPAPTARPSDLNTTPSGSATSGKYSVTDPTTGAKSYYNSQSEAVSAANKLAANLGTTVQDKTSSNKDSGGSSSSSSGGGCVVATHAVASGAFTPKMKREAVVWCMDVLHGKWWGEAIRRGYRHLGRKKIEQGKAHEHYTEFRRYIAFANGSKRDLRGALTFSLRTAQFFVVGMINKEA